MSFKSSNMFNNKNIGGLDGNFYIDSFNSSVGFNVKNHTHKGIEHDYGEYVIKSFGNQISIFLSGNYPGFKNDPFGGF